MNVFIAVILTKWKNSRSTMKNEKSKFPPLEFVYMDTATNKTVVLEGRIMPVQPVNNNSAHAIPPITQSPMTGSTTVLQPSNAMGPMLYVLSVIIVYGLSMFLLVGTLARRKSYHKRLDVEVGRYIKGLRAAREEAKKNEVQRLRLNWPGNFIMFQQNANSDHEKSGDTTDSDVECYPAISKTLNRTSSEESAYIELPATTVNMVTETSDNMTDPVGTPTVTHNGHGSETEKKGVRFDDSNLERTANGHSQFSLREAICLSSENLNNILVHKNIQVEGVGKDQNGSHGLTGDSNTTNNMLHQETRKQGYMDMIPSINDPLLSDNPSDQPVENEEIQRYKKTKKRRKTAKTRELSSTEDIEDDPVMEEYHKSAAYRQRNRRRNSELNEAMKAVSLNKLTPHFGEKETPLAAVHLLGLPKSDMDMDSASDDPCFEEYRRSKLYRSRYRGKRKGLLDPMESRISISSAEGSPLLPQMRRIQQVNSTQDNPNLMILPPTNQLSKPFVEIKVTSPDNVEISDADTKDENIY